MFIFFIVVQDLMKYNKVVNICLDVSKTFQATTDIVVQCDLQWQYFDHLKCIFYFEIPRETKIYIAFSTIPTITKDNRSLYW